MSTLVTVFMPTHDRVESMSRAIASVLAQTHRELELIVVDDGSRDETWERLQRLAEVEPRLRIARNETSQGAPASRNRALSMARGEFITGLDDDDHFRPDRIALFVAAWQRFAEAGETPSCLYSQQVSVNGEREETGRRPERATWEQLFRSNLVGNQVYTRTAWLRELGGYDVGMPAWQDLDLCIRLLQRRGPARLVDHATYYMNVEDRADRISRASRERIEAAFRRLEAKQRQVPAFLRQGLFTQLFEPYYAFTPRPRDLFTLLSFGLHKPNLRRMLDAAARALFAPARAGEPHGSANKRQAAPERLDGVAPPPGRES
jgi:glycosyltransferase involved in cell wall biosynthesis